jgi:hypothetical protein
MSKTYTKEEQAEILKLANDAVELRNQYWDALSALENSLGFEVEDLGVVLEECPSEDCTDEEFTTFTKLCLDNSEIDEEEEEEEA